MTDFPLYLHLARVRFGFKGPKGRLMKCDGRRGSYWKVKLDDGMWLYPDKHIVHDTEGLYVRRCVECDLEFRSDKVNEPICPVCDRHLHAPRERDATADRGALRRIAWRDQHGGSR